MKLLKRYLGDTLGYRVTTAESGDAAIAVAMKESFNLCILDVRMRGQSGTEIYTRLKNMNPEIEAIFFTGDKEFENNLDFLRFSLPKERVLSKPIEDLSLLTRLIVSILGPPAP